MIFSPPSRRARPCAPVENGYLCFKEIRVSFEVSTFGFVTCR